MWNPETYRDTDYGLEPDETFEPDELEPDYQEPPQDAPHIQTVLGRIEPEDAGLALVREHLFREPRGADVEYRLTDPDAALLDLETFFTAGGRTVVDATSEDEGRSLEQLVWLAQRAPVHIIASTGGVIVDTSSIAALKETLGASLNAARDNPKVLPGLVVLGFGEAMTLADARQAFKLVAEETRDRPLPLMTMMNQSALPPLDVLAAAADAGIALSRIIFSGDKREHDLAIRMEMANTGAYLLFDHLGEGTHEQDKEMAVTIAHLVKSGHGQRVLLAHGYEHRSLLTGYTGSPGLGFIVEQFAILLLEAGVSALDVRTMLLDNCASALTIQSHPQ